MALTVSSIEQRISNRLNNKLDVLQIREVLEEKYRDIFNQNSWSFSKYSGGLLVIGPTSTGTITATLGSTTITGSGTDFLPSVGNYTDGWIEAEDAVYRVSGAPSSDTALTLDAGYAGTGGAGLAFTLFKNRYELGGGVTHVLAMNIGQNFLVEAPLSYILEIDPNRNSTGQPTYFAYCEMGASGGRIIELYPSPDVNYRVNYEGIKMGSFSLTAPTTVIEEQIVSYLFNACLGECCFVVAMKTGGQEAGMWMQLGTTYNEKADKLLAILAHKDLGSFGVPLIQRGDDYSTAYSGDFASNHDLWNE